MAKGLAWRGAVTLVLCILLCFSAACAQPGAAPNGSAAAPGWQANASKPVKLRWYVNFSWFTTTWGESLVARTITEETGIEIEFVTPAGNEWEKLDAMMNAGTLPDLITLGYWEPQIDEMITRGLVWPLNKLADEHDPWFWEVAQPQRVAWFTQEDGNLYGYPNSSCTPADYDTYDGIVSNQAFLVRQDIYRAIGSPDMSTPEGFAGAVRAAAAKFPEIGANALIPIGLYDFDKDGCFSLESILMNLLAVPYEKDGKVYDRYTDPDYLAWLKVFRRLCAEGYIGSEVFIDRRAQMAEKVADGRYFCLLYQHTDIAAQQLLLHDKDPGSVYIAVDGPKNAAGDAHTLTGQGINGWTVTMVSRASAYPERAIQLMSYMMSEHGQKLLFCGVEGETYDVAGDGGIRYREEALALQNTDRAVYDAKYGANNTYWMLQDLAMQQQWQQPMPEVLAQPRRWAAPYTVYTSQYDTVFAAGSAEAAAHQLIREEWGRTLPKLLLAADDEAFDELMDAFVAKRAELGYAAVQREATRQMLEAKERLGLL